MKLNRQQRKAGAAQASKGGRFLLLTPRTLMDHTLEDGTVVKVWGESERQFIVKSLKGLEVVTVPHQMSQAQATEIEKMLTHARGRDVIVTTDNVRMFRVSEISAADVAKMLEKGVPTVKAPAVST